MPGDILGGPPAMAGPSVGGGGPTPSFRGLASNGGAAGPAQPPETTPGAMQIGGAAVRMALEIDQAMKLLAQAVPQLAQWVQKTTAELRAQMGQALQSGGVPSDPTSAAGSSMPDGSQNL